MIPCAFFPHWVKHSLAQSNRRGPEFYGSPHSVGSSISVKTSTVHPNHQRVYLTFFRKPVTLAAFIQESQNTGPVCKVFIVSLNSQFSSVAQSCPTLCNPMNRSTPGLPVHHQLPEFTQVHRVSDAIQPSHPLSSPSPPAPNPSQHQSLFQ